MMALAVSLLPKVLRPAEPQYYVDESAGYSVRLSQDGYVKYKELLERDEGNYVNIDCPSYPQKVKEVIDGLISRYNLQ